MKLHESKSLAQTLRKARAHATELRALLEDAQGSIAANEVMEPDDDAWDEFASLIEDQAIEVGKVEDWLDTLPINPDGSAAADHFEVEE